MYRPLHNSGNRRPENKEQGGKGSGSGAEDEGEGNKRKVRSLTVHRAPKTPKIRPQTFRKNPGNLKGNLSSLHEPRSLTVQS